MPRLRFLSPYFASIGLGEAFFLLKAIAASPVIDNAIEREKLHLIISKHFEGSTCFSFSSGRGALACCLSAFALTQGDEVVLSAFTCLAVPTAVISVGATPVYADIDESTLNVTIDTINSVITSKTKIIVVQHTLGSPAPIDEIVQLAHSRGILVIEDCALSLGTKIHTKEVGTFGDAAIFSMELSKTLTTGWGGILIVNNTNFIKCVAEKYAGIGEIPSLQALRMGIQTVITGICYLPNMHWFAKYIVAIGFKLGIFRGSTPNGENDGLVSEFFISKLSGIQARLGARQWTRIESITESCCEYGIYLRNVLDKLGYIAPGNFNTSVLSVSPRVSFLVFNRNETLEWFSRRGVELGTWFDGPLSPLPAVDIYNYRRELYPRAVYVSNYIVNIPSHSRLDDADLVFIQRILTEYSLTHRNNLNLQAGLV